MGRDRQAGCRLHRRALPLLLAGIGGCTHVAPAPVHLEARIAGQAARTFDAPAAERDAALLAPGAQAGRIDRLTLFAALLASDPRVAEARAALETARRDARSARKVGSPTLTLSSEYANDPSTSSPWLLGGGVDLPLDIGGRRGARLARADLGVIAARYDLAEVAWADRMALVRALADHLIARRQAELGTAIVAMRDRQLAVLEQRVARGETAGLDLFPYRAQRAQAARALEDAQRRAQQARIAMAGVLGLPATALDGLDVAWDGFDAASTDAPALSPSVMARAVAGRADVLKAIVAYDQAEADLRGELARQYPAVSLGPGYTWERGLVKLPFAINLAVPSFDLNRAAIRAAEARRAQAGAAIETTLAQAQAAIESARAERAAASAALDRVRRTELPQTAAVARRADAQLAKGTAGRADWAGAQIAALEARLAEIDALARLRAADAALEDALRQPLEGPETMIDRNRLVAVLEKQP